MKETHVIKEKVIVSVYDTAIIEGHCHVQFEVDTLEQFIHFTRYRTGELLFLNYTNSENVPVYVFTFCHSAGINQITCAIKVDEATFLKNSEKWKYRLIRFKSPAIFGIRMEDGVQILQPATLLNMDFDDDSFIPYVEMH
jgi:hypothetical protein